MAIAVKHLTFVLLIFMLIKSAMITISYNNTRANLGTAFEGGTIYEAGY